MDRCPKCGSHDIDFAVESGECQIYEDETGINAMPADGARCRDCDHWFNIDKRKRFHNGDTREGDCV